MKVITIKQPHAELILRGLKKIELKNWASLLRGEVLIYAAQNPDEEAMKKYGFTYLPTGRIVGRAKVVDVKKYRNEKEHWIDRDLHLATSFVGNYGYLLEDVERIDLIPTEGKEFTGMPLHFSEEENVHNDYKFSKP